MKKLRVAVIGCGDISVLHLESIKSNELLELAAVCDIKSDRAKACADKYNTKYYLSYNEMFEKENLDAVHLCLPHYIHISVAMDAFKNGINVLSEKPMSIKYEDAVMAVETAEKNNLQYGVIFQCRYNAASQLVKNRIVDGKLGKVKCATVSLTWHRSEDYYATSDWKGTWEKEGGGVIINQAIHSLDLANWMIDSAPREIQSSLHNRNHSRMVVEDSAEGIIKYENGVNLSFYAMNNYLINEPIGIRLICENGNAFFSYDKAEIYYSDGTFETTDNTDCEEGIDGKEYWGSKHYVQINQFYRALLGIEELEISGREALKIQKIICDIYKNNDSKI